MNTPINWDLPVINGYNKPFTLLSLKGPKPDYPVIGYIADEGHTEVEIFSLEGKPLHSYGVRHELRNSPLRVTGWLLLRKDHPPKLIEDFGEPEVGRLLIESLVSSKDFLALKRIDLEVAVGTNDYADMYPTPLEEIVEEFKEVTGTSVTTVAVTDQPEKL